MLHEQKLTYPGKIKEILEDTIEAGKSLGMLTRAWYDTSSARVL
jgi:hypothetical protein